MKINIFVRNSLVKSHKHLILIFNIQRFSHMTSRYQNNNLLQRMPASLPCAAIPKASLLNRVSVWSENCKGLELSEERCKAITLNNHGIQINRSAIAIPKNWRKPAYPGTYCFRREQNRGGTPAGNWKGQTFYQRSKEGDSFRRRTSCQGSELIVLLQELKKGISMCPWNFSPCPLEKDWKILGLVDTFLVDLKHTTGRNSDGIPREILILYWQSR